MEELISIVVPIYNVEEYLEKSIDSIINQTYKNIEVILVDDGSLDDSGKICDKYSKKYSNIKVIHKKNGGLSDARNAGIKVANGEFILCIDSDDWIEKSMVETLYKNIKEYDADISICEFMEEDVSGKILNKKEENKHIKIFNSKEALYELILQSNITNHAWNKMYKKKLFNDVEYPKGQLMEDISTTYKLIENSNKIVYQNICLYHYIQRNTSILGNITEKRINDQEKAIFERNNYLLKKYSEFEDIINIDNLKNVKTLYYLAVLGGYNYLYKSKKYREYYAKFKKLYIKYKDVIIDKDKKSINLFYSNKSMYIIYVYLKKNIGKVVR